VIGSRSLESRLELASGWLKTCLETHENCSSTIGGYSQAPTRVIDVGPSDGSHEPFLRISDGATVWEWVTLSHCWGDVQPLKTTMESLSRHQVELPLSTLPRLFKDAVQIVRALNYRYLWIDSLCIIQDSKEDWQREVSNMGEIYKHSVFVISANACRNHTESMLDCIVDRKYVYQECHSGTVGFRGLVAGSFFKSSDRAPEILQTRAWTLQEDILSPRTLMWMQDQVVWECRATSSSEVFPKLEDSFNDPADLVANHWNHKIIGLSKAALQARRHTWNDSLTSWQWDPLARWYLILREFSKRQISFPRDTLPAISGIAKEVAHHTGFQYKAGIWAEDFYNGLLWSVHQTDQKVDEYSGPSWSWASVKNGMEIHPSAYEILFTTQKDNFLPKNILVPVAEILSVDTRYVAQDEFGSIISSKLRIKGPCKRMTTWDHKDVVLGDPKEYSAKSNNAENMNLAIFWLDYSTETQGPILSELQNRKILLINIARLNDANKIWRRSGTGMVNHLLGSSLANFSGESMGLVLEPVGNVSLMFLANQKMFT
jgi:hypothetical protein